MTIAEGRDTSTIRTGELRGCELTLLQLRPLFDHPGGYLLQLDRHPATYTRALTGAELVALARLNPDDGLPTHKPVLGLLADVTLALETLGAAWESMIVYHPQTGAFIPNAMITPPSGEELSTLGRLAGELLAACGVS